MNSTKANRVADMRTNEEFDNAQDAQFLRGSGRGQLWISALLITTMAMAAFVLGLHAGVPRAGLAVNPSGVACEKVGAL